MNLVELSRTASQMQTEIMLRYFERVFDGFVLHPPQEGDCSPWPRPEPVRHWARHKRYKRNPQG